MIPTTWPIGKMLKRRGNKLMSMCKHRLNKLTKNLYRMQGNKGLKIGKTKVAEQFVVQWYEQTTTRAIEH
jgi:hypothetical protein